MSKTTQFCSCDKFSDPNRNKQVGICYNISTEIHNGGEHVFSSVKSTTDRAN